MKAMGIGFPVVGDGCSKMLMWEEGVPQGVVGVRVAAWWKLGSVERPVPPITAMRTEPGRL